MGGLIWGRKKEKWGESGERITRNNNKGLTIAG